jgi:hypothetical protein
MATIARMVTVIEAQMQGFEKVTTTLESTNKSMEGMAGMASKLGTALVGAFSVSAVVGFAKEMVGFASDLKDMSAQTGIGVERLQALNLVGMQSGVTFTEIADGVSQLSKRLVGGDAGAVNAVERLGLNINTLLHTDPDLAFIRIAEAVAKVSGPMERNALMMELFGRSGAKFLPMVTTELTKMVDAAEKSRGIISSALIDKLDEFGDTAEVATQEAKGFAISLFEVTGAATNFAKASFGAFSNFFGQGNAMEDVLNRITAQANLATTAINPLGMSMKELNDVSKKLTADALASIERGLKKQAEDADKAAKAHTDLQRVLGLGHMKAAQEFVAAQAEIAAAQASTVASVLEGSSAINTALDEQADKWGNVYTLEVTNSAQEIDDALMRMRDHGVEYAKTLGEAWRELGDNMIDRTMTLVDAIGAEIGGRFGNIVGQMTRAWDNGRTLMKGIGKMMHGDFSGLVDTIMAGIGLIKSAWQAMKNLFGGGEEGTIVNPGRDKFLAQYGGAEGLGGQLLSHFMGQGMEYAEAEQNRVRLMDQGLFAADTVAKFNAAQSAIIDLIGGQKFHTGGMVPGTGEVPAMLLGGERVQSRGEVADMRGLLGEFRDLKFRLLNAIEVGPSQMRAQAQIQMGMGSSR